jgi:hypothetical protein
MWSVFTDPCLVENGGAFDQRQEIALHAFARHVAAHAAFARADLVELVEEDDAVLLHRLDRFQHELVLIEQLVGFLVDEDFMRFRDRDAPRLGRPPSLPKISPIEIAPICAPGMPGMSIIGMPPPPDCTSISISLSLSSPARNFCGTLSLVAGLAAGPTSASTTRVFGGLLRARLDVLALSLARLRDAQLDQVAHDLLHVAARHSRLR